VLVTGIRGPYRQGDAMAAHGKALVKQVRLGFPAQATSDPKMSITGPVL